jgi:hypothetical protein
MNKAISLETDDLSGSLSLDIGSSTSCDVSSYPWRMPRSSPKRRWVTNFHFVGPSVDSSCADCSQDFFTTRGVVRLHPTILISPLTTLS